MSTENGTGTHGNPRSLRREDGTAHRMSNRMTLRAAPRGWGAAVLLWAYWPRLDYASGLALQHRLHAARGRGEIPDVLLVTEHPATVTLGRRGSLADLPLGPSALAARGIALYQVGRGGRATFHGPGQLVAYPIVDLRALQIGPRRFVEALERAAVQVLRASGIEAEGGIPVPGVWVENRKIAAIGVEILGGITRHGLSLNLAGELGPFDFVVQCGIADSHATSVDALGVSPPRPIEVGAALANELGTVLGLHPREADATSLLQETRQPRRGGAVSLG